MKVIKTKLNYSNYYILLDLDTIKIGDVISFDIFIQKNDDFVIIIEAGTLISENLYNKLKNQKSLYIHKDKGKDEDKQILSCESLRHYIRHSRDDVEKRIKVLYDVNDQLFDIFLTNKENKINIECLHLIVQSIIYLVKYDASFLKSTIPYFVNDNMLKNHSLQVAIYALVIGNILKFKDDDLLKLGVAALLHDIGFKKIDETIINKKSMLTPQEISLMQKHSQHSVEIIEQNKIHDPYIINAVMHHHERYDGSGYPNQLMGDEISNFASIVGICDVFDALTNNRPHREHYSSFNALKMMMRDKDMVNKFNQNYLHLFLKSFL
ncbi:HD domain-containing phosphohydrolase [Sulfurimonas sp. RIFOXYB12_FULL_35_9]|uniref:HD-GYP domain-containing protein n=1 Tax=Sulfurimonas sp. RIFOXYB12_FULL_35_9 TaxID=1802256 RepID=UPI0008BA18E8|nr:HD domain-containing phosphohydrolase [Sulfurimonas sp. RIFOXYB12_FULL_35_9]OHE03941.1 MAG: phosphohydrolase [Sulfurimonas sp. RIFOXYB12_FULL_35_9]